MTHLLYLKDNYLTTFESIVKAIEPEKGYIVLQDTLFHPQGGHQIYDTGVIEQGDISLDVIEVKSNNGEVQHYVRNKDNLRLIKINEPVKARINWERRHQLMKTHTAQHLFSALAKSILNLESIDMTIDVEACSIKFDKTFEIYKILNIQDEVNKLIISNLKVTRNCNDDVYIVNIGDVDYRKCGCTHIKELREIGQIYVYKIEANKVLFKVGLDANLERTSNQSEVLNIQVINRINLTELLARYTQLVEKEKKLTTELTSVYKELFSMELNQRSELYDSANKNLIVIKRPELDIKTVKTIISDFFESKTKVVVVICKNDTALVFSNIEAIPANNITEIFKYNETNFKGGGNKTFSQGGAWGRTVQETYNLIESALLEVSAFCD